MPAYSPIPAMVEPSTGTTVVFVVIMAVVVVAFVAATARADRVLGGRPLAGKVALGTAVWLAATAAAGASGLLGRQTMPPPVNLFFVASMGVALWVALSSVGQRLASGVPLAGLVAIHAFRLPLELVLHQWHAQGVLPVQMTYSGRNFDIVTGILAVVVGAWLWRAAPSVERARKVVFVFNVVGLGLLVTVASIAVTSTPGPLRLFTNDPPLLLAMHFPYGWIVPFGIGAALTGHIVIFRWLRIPQRGSADR